MEIKVIEKKQGKIDRATGTIISRKLRVSPYVRVSSDSEEQMNSYNSQLQYYEEKISTH